ncbi:SAM-dependent methyltransferase [Acidipropionibacterium timonense]|uniref:SAM-dependent methyltransferase n=1 Tax=Acidipropionibacterium timonense TaxID=2161818 RepID=UPI001032422D|nr:class I SAM-dependent methyltransferase [Acidipropionibacterium timonense]
MSHAVGRPPARPSGARGDRPHAVVVDRPSWDDRYRQFPDLFGDRPNDFLVECEILLPRAGRVLVVGDGQGRNGVWLASRGFRVTTVDLSAVGCEQARARALRRGVEMDVHCADLLDWCSGPQAQGPWDAVVWVFVHLTLAERCAIGAALGPRLAPGGVLVQETYSTAQPLMGTGGPADPALLSHRDDAAAQWPDLVVDSRAVERRIFEGRAHQGPSSTIQVLGRAR